VAQDQSIGGRIDFGDLVSSYTVCDLAIALAYAMLGKADPVSMAAHMVAGFHEVNLLSELEIELLYPLICARLCTSVSLAAFRKQQTPENAYLTVSEQPAWWLLDQLKEVGPSLAHYIFRQACGLPPVKQHGTVTSWLLIQ